MPHPLFATRICFFATRIRFSQPAPVFRNPPPRFPSGSSFHAHTPGSARKPLVNLFCARSRICSRVLSRTRYQPRSCTCTRTRSWTRHQPCSCTRFCARPGSSPDRPCPSPFEPGLPSGLSTLAPLPTGSPFSKAFLACSSPDPIFPARRSPPPGATRAIIPPT